MAHDSGSDRVVADRYTLRRCLGQGGMGTVWLADDGLLGREVAVKEVTFPLSITDDERRSLRERTLREARAAARFQHARVTTVYDVVEEDGRPWIVMEHVPSRSLSEVLRANGPLPVARVAQIGLDVLEALTAAHRAGIVHRDVKPANVLVSHDGRAWLTDFGIATSSGDQRLTGHHVLLGSPAYIAPERARGDEPGPPADLWSLGATLFTAVEGRAPFERAEAMATLMAAASEDPPAAPRAGALEPLLRALLASDPGRRATAEHARVELQGALRTGPSAAPPLPAPRPERAGGAQTGAGQAGAAQAGAAQAGAAQSRDEVQRLDVKELSTLAAAAGRALAGSAAREVSRRAARRSEERQAPGSPTTAPPPRRGRVAATQAPAKGGAASRSAHPASRSTRPAPGRADQTRQPAPRSTWRFKRRWVGVPLLMLLLLVASVIGLFGIAGAALLGLG